MSTNHKDIGTLYLIFAASGRRVDANPWGAGATTLEWTVSSLPPFHSYDEIPPIA